MTKYRISNNITINGQVEYENTPTTYRQGYFVLFDGKRDNEYLINETVNYFINKFSPAKTLSAVLEEIQVEMDSHSKEMEETCSSFFTFLCKRKILVPENKIELPVTCVAWYKKGDSINGMLILEILSNKSDVDIYQVRDNTSGVVCVMKLLNRKKIGDEEKYEKETAELKKEYLLLKKMNNSPGICQAHAFNKDEAGNVYILMEYIRGKSLSRFLRERKKLSLIGSFELVENILEVFAQLHNKKIIHGDIHSSNILVARDKAVKIIDLGFSVNAKTEKNQVVSFGGVNYYMPPERINVTTIKKFSKEPDLYSDVYQVGLLIYLVLYNTLPFEGFIWEELAQNIKAGRINFPQFSSSNHVVPQTIISLVEKCLSTKPEDRYHDATKILKDFKKGTAKKKIAGKMKECEQL